MMGEDATSGQQCVEGPQCCLTCGFKLLTDAEMRLIWERIQAIGGCDKARFLFHAVEGLPERLLKLDTAYDPSLAPGKFIVTSSDGLDANRFG
jgi:hypothetical protein